MDIKKVLKAKGITMKEVAAKMPNQKGTVGITIGALSQMVNGHSSLETLRTIAKIVGCKVGDFFDDERTEQVPTVPTIKCPYCGKSIPLDIKVHKE